MKSFNIRDEKIHVVPFGLSNPPRPSHNKKERILIYIGMHHPRKNIQALLDAYTLLLSQGLPYKLVLLGNSLTKSELSAWVRKNPRFQDRLLDRGFVSEKEKREWLQRAALLIMPSLYEGFGFPILEALSSGTPVIGSNLSAIPEILGEGGILIDPYDPQSIATAISQALSSSDGYERLVQKALKQAAQFSHKRMIDQVLSVYEQIL